MPRPRDIDAEFRAIRARLGSGKARAGGGGAGSGARGPAGPQGPPGPKGIAWKGAWAVDQEYEVGDLVQNDTLTFICVDAQTSSAGNEPHLGGNDVWVEVSLGYLAVSGERPMAGDLNMGENDIAAAVDGHFSGSLTMDGGVGTARISAPRVISLAGDDSDGEARLENAERIVFNDEPTKSVIEKPSRIEYNVGVTAGDDYTAAEGKSSWDDLEGTLVVWVASGAALVLVAVGWAVKLAANGLYVE